MKLDCFGITTIGRREENQDAFFWKVYDQPQGCLKAVVAVCDGMGGHHGGQTASRLAIQTIERYIPENPPDQESIKSWIHALCQAIQTTLDDATRNDPYLSEMGTTLVMGLITEEAIWIVNIGDSRAYKIKGDQVEQLTHDHSAIQEAFDKGYYTWEEIRQNPVMITLSSALTRHLGPGFETEPDIFKYQLEGDECFLFCTDGLTGNMIDIPVSPYEIGKYVYGSSSLETAANNLLSLAYQNGSNDNITAVILKTGEKQVTHPHIPIEPSVDSLRKNENYSNPLPITQWTPNRSLLISALVLLLMALCGVTYLYIEQSYAPSSQKSGGSKPILKTTPPPSVFSTPTVVANTPTIPPSITPVPPELNSLRWHRDMFEYNQPLRSSDALSFTYNPLQIQKETITILVSDSPSMSDSKIIPNVPQWIKDPTGSIPVAELYIEDGTKYVQLKAIKNQTIITSDVLKVVVNNE